jgi:hypothetical protein
MRKSSFIQAAVCGLIASLAFVTPSQATSYVINVSEQVQIQNSSLLSDTISAVEIDYSGLGGSLTNVSFMGSALNFPAGYLPTSAVAVGSPLDGVMLSVTGGSASLLTGTIYFDTVQSTNDVTALAASIQAISETVIASASTTFYGPLHFAVVSVPEPSSMALLGIGMTGFLAFRRLFKRSTPTA